MHSVENPLDIHLFRHNVKKSQKNFIKVLKGIATPGNAVYTTVHATSREGLEEQLKK